MGGGGGSGGGEGGRFHACSLILEPECCGLQLRVSYGGASPPREPLLSAEQQMQLMH